MPHAVSSASPGLQALILCGPGSSFPTFTANPDEHPKALLPIANRPMVWYPIDYCYRAGITDISLICPPSASEALTSALNTNPLLTALPLPRPDVVAPEGLDLTTGTAEILRLPEVRALVTADFLVLPCDLICEVGGDQLLQAWMVKAASLHETLGNVEASESGQRHSGALGVWYNTKVLEPVKGEERDFVAVLPPDSTPVPRSDGSLLPHVSTLVGAMPMDTLADLTEEQKGFPIRHSLIKRHPRVRMLTTHRDAHIYVFPRWVMDFVAENEKLETIGEDLVGWWAKSWWQKGLSEKLHVSKILSKKPPQTDLPATAGTETPTESEGEAAPPSPTAEDPMRGAASKAEEDSEEELPTHSIPSFQAYIHPSKSGSPMIRRVDTSLLLLTTSLQLAKLPSVEEAGIEAASPFAHPKKIAYPEGRKPKTTVTTADTLIAENVTIEEKVSIKESVVGPSCRIHESAKLAQCVIMDGAVIGKGCKLTKCIIGKRAIIGERCVLMDCEVQENLLVEADTEDKGAKLMSSEGLEATAEDMENLVLADSA